MSETSSYTLRDLKTGSLFMTASLAVAGVYLIFVPLMLIALPFSMMENASPNGMNVQILFIIMMAGNLVLGPLMFGLYVILGRWVYGKIFPQAEPPVLLFEGEGYWFHTLKPKSIYQALVPCFRGMLLGFGCLFVPFWALALIASLFTLQFSLLGAVLAQAAVMAIAYFIYPYIWAFFVMLGSYVVRPMTRRFEWGELKFLSGEVDEVTG